ncbi:MAG: hypothetical protein KBS41_04975 [Oscillospiraceae bacterium]|nr:hypothetical protein [Candidatus Equicaccousia limihippi]
MDNNIIKKPRSLECGSAIKILSVIALISIVLFCLTDLVAHVSFNREITFSFVITLLLEIACYVLFVLYIFIYYDKPKSTTLVLIIFALKTISFIPFALVYVSALFGFRKKVLHIIAISIQLLVWAFYLVDCIIDLVLGFNGGIYSLSCIAMTSFSVAVLLLGTKNIIKPVISYSPEKAKIKLKNMKPEQALKFLNEQLELNMITQEEYQAQRAEIINKL